MITLKFKGHSAFQTADVGPATGFLFDGDSVRMLPSESLVATYSRHHWVIGHQHYTRLECIGECKLLFRSAEGSAASSSGPYEGIWCAAGFVYARDALKGRLVDGSLLWHCPETQSYWPNLVLESATASNDG